MDIKDVIGKVKEWSKTLDPEEKAALDKVLDKALTDEELQDVAGGWGCLRYGNAAARPPLPK